MAEHEHTALDRRTMLALVGAGSAAALAGCLGGDGGNGTPTPTATPSDQVPEQYRTATGLGGGERDPDNLASKGDVSYQPQPQDGQQCSGCTFYIPDKNGDGAGACTIVEGTIDPSGYCTSYVAHETDGGDSDGQSASPVDVPEDAHCAVCDMMAANFPEWNAQAVHGDDTREFFCTSGCATTYYALPDQFAETDADIAGLWVRDLNSRALVDGTTAYYALETEQDRLEDPMRVNPAPFEAREDAVAYVDEVEYLAEEDIVELSAFDRELAEQYRGQLVE
ncbi:nitrous oxide reductase accessory protein NosL [Haloarchaeobius iranensis]|uniref:High potential iron-sulfur protein n=1 Tax=Haloarchaeobius iranensis TaxID=996166 RepID=A0A1G9YN34_9EURY|nr:nitrous oxide reductase accessory protein NosL [Haloarchaeobius iranensis]SDN10462.1 High potential iron-sulfur protein [Haloarchaeobius iranensis]